MLKRVQSAAERSVARACAFAALAGFCLMVGLSSEAITMAMQAGGMLALLTCCVLLLKAWLAQSQPYKRTEVWGMLEPDERPPAAVAQQVIGDALRAVYLRFAMHAALLATGFLVLAAVLSLGGVRLRL